MDILTTSLEALLQRATNPQNENVDKAAVEAFCALVNKESEGSHIAIRLVANKIHAQNEREALQTLGVLDACMKKCGMPFQSEVGKFRFLNEMIKLVSPKYLGSQTPPLVRVKVLQLLQVWTDDYPRETKIKEAYDMLKKQGVVVEVTPVPKPVESVTPRPNKTNSIFDNDERSRLLQKLLQSKNPDDLQAANRLIKTMVKEDDKRAELVSKRVIELEAVHNNVRLLNEMLDSYRPGHSSADELDLIKELHQSCERLRPNVFRLAAETQQNEEMLKEILQASDELGQVFDKYIAIIVKSVIPPRKLTDGDSLLDLGSPSEAPAPALLDNASVVNNNESKKSDEKSQSDIDALCDIFSSHALPPPLTLPESTILKPTTVQQPSVLVDNNVVNMESDKSNSKLKALEDLDALGETLLKENLSGTATTTSRSAFNRVPEKIPMNLLTRQVSNETQPSDKSSKILPSASDTASGLDLNFLIRKSETVKPSILLEVPNGDDCMVDITVDNTDTKMCLSFEQSVQEKEVEPAPSVPVVSTPLKVEIKPLIDISVTLESVKPSSVPPLTVLEEKNGISVILHFAKDKPREDVQVIVVTTLSKNTSPLTNYHFQAVVPKICKIKLQPPSGSDLPAYNPFLPPSAITQIMLLANPNNEQVSLKFMISYTMDDDMCTEMGEVDCLPVVP
ncbi:Golgi-localized gamma-adaptin ear containing ARF binding protein [Carabus blaptoides fortunei]